MDLHVYDVAVIGGGIAGYSAALTSKNLHMDYIWLGNELFGEKVQKSEYVRNYPAFSGNGEAFFAALSAQCDKEGVLFTRARADGIYRGEVYTILSGEQMFSARAVILCTGVDLKGTIEGEAEWTGKGVSYCAVCDGALYRGKIIAAVLSSPRHVQEAEYLASLAAHVHVFCTSEVSFSAKNITLHTCLPRRIEGEKRVEAVIAGERIPVAGVFLLRDAAPPSALIGGWKTEGPHVTVTRDMGTGFPGLYAAGDVTGTPYQYAKAAGEGLVAAYSVRTWLSQKK